MLAKLLTFVLVVTTLLAFPVPAFALETPTLLPIADGFYKQWTPKTGSLHYSMVDESFCNGLTDFVRNTEAGEKDSFTISLADVPNGATITKVSLTPCASFHNNKPNQTSELDLFYRLNGVDSSAIGDYILTNSSPMVLPTATFSGLTSVKTATSSMEVGALLSVSTQNKGAKLSQLMTVLSYTPLVAPSDLVATATISGVRLTWEDNSTNEQGFKLEISTNSANFVPFITLPANYESYIHYSVPAGHWYYRVRSYNVGADSSYSNIADIIVP